MPTTSREGAPAAEGIAPQVEHDVPGVDVLAVELLTPSRFCVYVDHRQGVDHALCERVTDVLRAYLREYAVEVSSPGLDRPLRTREHFERGGRPPGAAPHRRAQAPRRGRFRRRASVTVAASDGTETDIPYAEIVRANLIDEGA